MTAPVVPTWAKTVAKLLPANNEAIPKWPLAEASHREFCIPENVCLFL